MGKAYIKNLEVQGSPYVLHDIVTMGSGSPPDRPHPEPPLGIWGPTDPRPTHPIAGIPGLPGYEPGPGPGPGPGPSPGPGVPVTIVPLPVTDPPMEVPAGLPPASTPFLVVWPGGAGLAWGLPYASTGPVEPPPA